MKANLIFAASGFAALAFAGVARADQMPMDTPVTMNGVETVCTGIGDEAQADPRWKAYPARIEFSNGGAQYLSGVHVSLAHDGKTISTFDCAGAWILFRLPPGEYKVTANLLYEKDGQTRSMTLSPPATGQKRFVLQFSGVNPNQ